MRFSLSTLFLLLVSILVAGCASAPPYRYHYVPGKTAVLREGYAIAPPAAPPEVQAAIAAANRIAGLPYSYGGGHGPGMSSAYDCSGAASYVLSASGRLGSPIPSHAFRSYGERGMGRWISVYARKDHVFLVVAGLRFDTGWTGQSKGPRWTTLPRPARGAVLRHPTDL